MKSLVLLFITAFTSLASAKMVFQKQTKTQRLVVLADNDGSHQKVISDPTLDTYHPEISGSGRYVAYSRGQIQPGKAVRVEIVIKDLTTGKLEVWTPKGNQYIHAEFSGNDRFLALSALNKKNANQNIQIIDLHKERQKGPKEIKTINGITTHFYNTQAKIIKSQYDTYAPAVSSDGSFVVYHRTLKKNDKTAPKQLILYDLKTDTKTELTEASKHAMFPSLSADDRYISYVSKDSGQWDIYLYDLWSKTTTAVTNDANIEFTPVFANDGSLFYTRFSQSHNGDSEIDIYKINKDQVFDSSQQAQPMAFLNDPAVAEYVPSFSNNNSLSINSAPKFLAPERSSFGSAIYKGKIYIAGGHQGPEHTYPEGSFLNQLEVYDTNTETWSSLAPMPKPKHGFQMVAFANFIYVFGGFAFSKDHLPTWKSLDTIERYDISSNTWSTLAQKLPQPRSSHAIATVDGKVYLLGGWDSTPKYENDKEGLFLRTIDVFDLKTQSIFTSPLELPNPLRRALSSVVVDDQIYLLGGIGEGSSHFEWVDNMTQLNPKTQVWAELPPLPFATFAPGVGAIKKDIFLIGGMVLKNKTNFDLDYVDDIYRFDYKLKRWSHSGVYLNQNKGFPQVVPMANNRLGILGGHTYDFMDGKWIDHPVNSFEILGL